MSVFFNSRTKQYGFGYLHDPGKIYWVSTDNLDPNKQIFNHRDDDGLTMHIDIEKVIMLIDSNEISHESFDIDLDPEMTEFLINNSGIELDHLSRMPKSRLDLPGIDLYDPETQLSLLIDGNHRYVARSRLGLKTMGIIRVTSSAIKTCLLDIPESIDLING